jgi:site-specific recombinase XerD
VLDETTVAKYDHYVDYWHQAFRTIACVTSLAVEDYWRARLQKVQRNTVKKELSALRGFLTWCKENGHLEAVPVVTNPPKRATGKRCVTAKRRATQLDQVEVEKLLEALPEMSSGRGGEPFPVRDRFIVAWETALRPATLIFALNDFDAGIELVRHDVPVMQERIFLEADVHERGL